jgi:hypothetical protein
MERDWGIERLPNMLSKMGSNARSLTVVLCTDHRVVCLDHVEASMTWPAGLGTGAVAQGAGGGRRAEAAEICRS